MSNTPPRKVCALHFLSTTRCAKFTFPIFLENKIKVLNRFNLLKLSDAKWQQRKEWTVSANIWVPGLEEPMTMPLYTSGPRQFHKTWDGANWPSGCGVSASTMLWQTDGRTAGWTNGDYLIAPPPPPPYWWKLKTKWWVGQQSPQNTWLQVDYTCTDSFN